MYHETMFGMMKKINAKEKILGWYTTGRDYKNHDIDINELFKRYMPDPVFLTLDVETNDPVDLPIQCYTSVEKLNSEGVIIKAFEHVPSIISAFDSEEVGVEHLLRDVKDTNMVTLTNSLNKKILGLKG